MNALNEAIHPTCYDMNKFPKCYNPLYTSGVKLNQPEIMPSPSTVDSTRPAQRALFCPFIGTQDDPGTCFSYPNPGNFCYRVQPPSSVDSAYQMTTCLTDKHNTCKVFSTSWQGALPNEIRGPLDYKPGNRPLVYRKQFILISIMFSVVIILMVLLGLSPGRGQLLAIFSRSTPTAMELRPSSTLRSSLASATPTTLDLLVLPTRAASSTPTASLTPTITPTATEVPPTSGPGMATPFGPNLEYVIFQLQDGQSLGTLASRFNTTIDVLKAMNAAIIEGASVRPGTVLVIMPGVKDATGLPRFSVIQITQLVSLAELAEKYNVSVEDLRLYNHLGMGDLVPSDRWLLIPEGE